IGYGTLGSKDTYSVRIHRLPFMAPSARSPRLRYAKPGANPTLETIEYVVSALQKSDGPISRKRILATLARWGHSTTRPSLNAALAFVGDEGLAPEASKGRGWV